MRGSEVGTLTGVVRVVVDVDEVGVVGVVVDVDSVGRRIEGGGGGEGEDIISEKT